MAGMGAVVVLAESKEAAAADIDDATVLIFGFSLTQDKAQKKRSYEEESFTVTRNICLFDDRNEAVDEVDLGRRCGLLGHVHVH